MSKIQQEDRCCPKCGKKKFEVLQATLLVTCTACEHVFSIDVNENHCTVIDMPKGIGFK
jgi:predicted nucleic-acid-binding Zn-ribbon protein